MRWPEYERDGFELLSAEERHAAHPDTFWIPTLQVRSSLQRGQAAKLLFDILFQENGRPMLGTERMWVIVSRQEGNVYVGVLDSTPHTACGDSLRPGVEVPFLPEHVCDVGDPPKEHSNWRLEQPAVQRGS
ncbi:hypothetical protein [Deinococcus sedimenti]|uniref:DUF2314 domain-containing protein n=1 Tax=Deinococcus sedimenti TaxID=1867090 RepID=A0ABQ2S0Z4_9DEIO|nr:hypothetical protein [Deinococcus sedimenti]GGR77791.1 hypothetical protein GCM10008960_00610 [Deinococcus sedimenti]